jgi:hypothetical protein
MDLPEETPGPDEPSPSEESFQEPPVLPEGYTPIGDYARMPRARRRRAHRMLVPPGADERAALLDNLARRAFPSFEFFLFAFLCGIVLGAGYLLDLKMNSQALLLLGVLLAPALTPWVGMVLAGITGSWRYFFLTFGVLLVAAALVFLTGGLAGLAGRLWLPAPALTQADIRSHLWWLDLFIVALGAVLMTISFIRSDQKPVIPSVLLAYGLFMPLSAAGFQLGINTSDPWSNGLLVFLIHLALATLVGGIVLAALHFKPAKAGGYVLPVFLGLLSLGTLFIFTGLVAFIRDGITATRRIEPTPTRLSLPTVSPTVFQTATPVVTLLPSTTFTLSPTFIPTPAYAVINAPATFGGANLRSEPAAGELLSVISNGLIVQVLPEIETVGQGIWVHVRWDDTEGWVLQSVLTATILTPSPVPSPTIKATP